MLRRVTQLTDRWLSAEGVRARASRILLDSYYVVTGRGGTWLHHKEEYHRRRRDMEREFLASAAASDLRRRACPACGEPAVSRRFSNPVGFEFAICDRDGVVYMDPAPSEAALGRLYNDPAESYKHVGGHKSAQVRPTNAEDLDALLRLAPPALRGGRLLDVGCAVGGFLLSAQPHYRVFGVELSETTAAVARQQGLDVTAGRLGGLAGERRFQVITMLQLIEHIVELTDFMAAARRLLADDGALYISTPSVDSASFAYLGERHIHVASFGHVSVFTRAGLRALAERTGFRVAAHEYWGGADLSLADVAVHELSPTRFSHRMAMYNPRLYYACDLAEQLGAGDLRWRFAERGADSYQRAVLVKA